MYYFTHTTTTGQLKRAMVINRKTNIYWDSV